jgi:CBS domain-containing protein
MHRFALANGQDSRLSTPDMTINEAAETMERHHARQLLIGRGSTPVGVLTEEDIVAKVLALGLDPNRVRVADVMANGHLDRRGAFQVDDADDVLAPLWAAERLDARETDDETLISFVEGRCEECGVFSEGLSDHEGLLMCNECSGMRSALFG